MADVSLSADMSTLAPNHGDVSASDDALDRTMLAASLAVIAEQSTKRRDRVALHQAADQLVETGDIHLSALKLPARWRAIIDAGVEHQCVVELLDAERLLSRSRHRRSQRAASVLTYSAITYIVVIAFVAATLLFGWNSLRPLTTDLQEMASLYGEGSESISPYVAFLVLASLLIAGLLVPVLALVLVVMWRSVIWWNRDPLWMSCILGGARLRQLVAREETLLYLAVFVARDRPLVDAFEAISNIGRSPATRRAAKNCSMLAKSGTVPLEQLPASDFGTPLLPLMEPLSAERLREESSICATLAEVEAERGLQLARLAMTIATALMLLCGFLVVALPGMTTLIQMKQMLSLQGGLM